MKRFTALLLSLILMISFTPCGGNANSADSSANQPKEPVTPVRIGILAEIAGMRLIPMKHHDCTSDFIAVPGGQ